MKQNKYITLINKAEALEQAALRAESLYMKNVYTLKAQLLREQAEELAVGEA